MSTALVLFRRDLRLADNPAWSSACAEHAHVLPVFIHADDEACPAGSASRWWLHHALRNALLPLVALGGLQIGNMLAFTLLTETVFQWPGMGFLFLEAVTRADVPLITTYLVAVGFLFVVTNTLADIVSLWLDPRISLEARR